jgi:hypothetical protein
MRVITAWAGSVPAEERGPLYVALYQSLGDEDTCIQVGNASTPYAIPVENDACTCDLKLPTYAWVLFHRL